MLLHCYLGKMDVTLSAKGRRQVETLRRNLYLKKNNMNSIYCSPLKRCLETMQLLKISCSKINIVHELMEISFGLWEGKCFKEINKENPKLVNKWSEGRSSFRFPGGESLREFYQRIELISKLIHKNRQHAIILITHAGVIRHLICNLLELNYKNHVLFKIPYASLTVIELTQRKGVLCSLGGPLWPLLF